MGCVPDTCRDSGRWLSPGHRRPLNRVSQCVIRPASAARKLVRTFQTRRGSQKRCAARRQLIGAGEGWTTEPPVGIEPTTFSLRDKTQGSTRLHRSPLNCGNALKERCYDGLGTAATATELHRAALPRTRSCCCCGCSATGPTASPTMTRLPDALVASVQRHEKHGRSTKRVPVRSPAGVSRVTGGTLSSGEDTSASGESGQDTSHLVPPAGTLPLVRGPQRLLDQPVHRRRCPEVQHRGVRPSLWYDVLVAR